MTRKRAVTLGFLGLVGLGLACGPEAPLSGGDEPAPGGTGESTPASTTRELVVIHARDGIHTLPVDAANRDALFIKVRDAYPALCFDRDDDHNHIPACVDDDWRRSHRSHASDDDGGVDDGGMGGGDHGGLGCQRCNRGPGNAGDFRLRIDGRRVELQRGRVFALLPTAAGFELTVPTPGGTLTVVVDDTTDEGREVDVERLVGAEVRVKKGKLLEAAGASSLRVLAGELEVLCPGPRALPVEQVPAGAQPLPPTGGGDGPGPDTLG